MGNHFSSRLRPTATLRASGEPGDSATSTHSLSRTDPVRLSNPIAFCGLIFALALAGCASVPTPPDATGGQQALLAECRRHYELDERRIINAGVRDVEFRLVPGHPYLRTDRFHAALTDRLDDHAARAIWLEDLARLDTAARAAEWNNLAPDIRPGTGERDTLNACRQSLLRNVATDEATFAVLRAAIRVDDNYRDWQRALGLYPLTALAVLRGVDRLHARENRYFHGTGSADAPRQRYAAPASDATIEPGYDTDMNRDVLGIPRIDGVRLRWLMAAHSPIWSVAERSPADRIGHVTIADTRIAIDTTRPTQYNYISYTIFEGRVLLQLNYTVWFPERPKRSAFDIYAGRVDGITWRVTLGDDGHPILADTMHNCGCYYMAFPGPQLRARAATEVLSEPLWIPQSMPRAPRGRPVIHLSDGEHYVRGIDWNKPVAAAKPLQTLDYEKLKNLPAGAGHYRNLFAADGLVKDSKRGERFVLWPMGIPSAGAMREAGHHAIAFVGRRHFDDPDLIDRYFERAGTDP